MHAHWAFAGDVYEVVSMFALPDDAWVYQLTGLRTDPPRAAGLGVVIPDAGPYDGPFTPKDSTQVRVRLDEGRLPWPVVMRFKELVETSGDIVTDPHGAKVIGDLSLSSNTWRLAGREFEANSFYHSDRDSWCYELFEVDPDPAGNNYLMVSIPDRQATGQFVAASAGDVVLDIHGSWTLPWLVLRHFLEAIVIDGPVTAHAVSADAGWDEREPGPGPAARATAWTVAPATNPPPPEHDSGDLELLLVAPGPTPIALIRAIRVITGFGLLDAKALLNDCPSVVVTGLSASQATEFCAALRDAGATAELRPRTESR